uniref:Placenta-specific protein 9 n=1 Tax=Salvator merianae TaxID=96440 RepID=A0A8D0DMH3_SALMN
MLSFWFLLFILTLSGQGLVAADPVTDPHESPDRNGWCDNNYNTIQRRLDAIQEHMEKTVEHLDSEVKSLLNIISDSAWNVPLAPETPLVDIFKDTS